MRVFPPSQCEGVNLFFSESRQTSAAVPAVAHLFQLFGASATLREYTARSPELRAIRVLQVRFGHDPR